MLAVYDGALPAREWGFSSVTKLGGEPTVMKLASDPEDCLGKYVKEQMCRICGRCGHVMVLIAQCFAPIVDGVNRMLYVYGCNNSTCALKASEATWRCWSVTIDAEDEEALNDDGKEDEDAIEEINVPLPPNSLPPFALDVIEEPKEDPKFVPTAAEVEMIAVAEARAAAMQQGKGDGSDGTVSEADIKELEETVDLKDKPTDRAYEFFRTRMSREPTQVIRYGRGARELFMNPQLVFENCRVPPCLKCGKARAMELQVMPTAMYYLHPDKHTSAPDAGDGLDFATITVYTCSMACTAKPSKAKDQPEGIPAVCVQEEFMFVEPPPSMETERDADGKASMRDIFA